MAGALPPPPIGEPPGSFAWQQWYTALQQLYSVSGAIPWSAVNKDGSNITDIATRPHNSLTTIQGGAANDYYHLTSAQLTSALGLIYGAGAPAAGTGSNGNFYFRSDGGAGSYIYHKAGGAWTAIV